MHRLTHIHIVRSAHTHRHTQTNTDTHRHTQTHTHTDTQTQRNTHTHRYTQTGARRNTQTETRGTHRQRRTHTNMHRGTHTYPVKRVVTLILRTGALVGYIQQSSSRNLRALKVYSAEPLFSSALDWIFWAYSKPLQYSTMQEVIQLNCRPAGLAFSNFCSTSLSSEKTLQEHKDASILASQALTGRLRWLWSQLSSQSPLHLRTLMSCQWRQIKLTQTHFKRRMPNPQRQEVHTFTHKKTHTHSFPLSLSLSVSRFLAVFVSLRLTLAGNCRLHCLFFSSYNIVAHANNKQTTQRQYVARFEASIGKILCLSICACSTRVCRSSSARSIGDWRQSLPKLRKVARRETPRRISVSTFGRGLAVTLVLFCCFVRALQRLSV